VRLWLQERAEAREQPPHLSLVVDEKLKARLGLEIAPVAGHTSAPAAVVEASHSHSPRRRRPGTGRRAPPAQRSGSPPAMAKSSPRRPSSSSSSSRHRGCGAAASPGCCTSPSHWVLPRAHSRLLAAGRGQERQRRGPDSGRSARRQGCTDAAGAAARPTEPAEAARLARWVGGWVGGVGGAPQSSAIQERKGSSDGSAQPHISPALLHSCRPPAAGIFSSEVNALRSSSQARSKLLRSMVVGAPVGAAVRPQVSRIRATHGCSAAI
jgi:hypothetical protein